VGRSITKWLPIGAKATICVASIEHHWKTVGPKRKGKIHIYCGTMDNYYLNYAVVLAQRFLESTTAPYYDGKVTFGDGAEHRCNSDPDRPNATS